MADDSAVDAFREAIDRFAEEVAPTLVARAKEEALRRAAATLAEEIERSLVARARSHLAANAPARSPVAAKTRPEPDPAPEPTTELAHWVYGIAWADECTLPDGLEGVDPSHPPFTIEHGALSAIASFVPLAEFGEEQLHENLNDVAWLERTARAHESVLDAALAESTVVPLRLCTIYRSEEQVREMLDGERAVFEDALRRLAGKTEWGVKLIAQPGALERAAVGEDEESESEEEVSPGVAYMRQRGRETHAREVADGIAEEWADEVHRRASSHAAEALLNPLQNPEISGHEGEMLLNGVYLVDDDDADAFRAEVAAMADELELLGASVELTGPWPPYNFVKGSIEAAR